MKAMCRALVYDGSQRCAIHKVPAGRFADKARGTRQQRGYGREWSRAREETMREQAGLCQPHLRRGFVVPDCRICDHAVAKAFGGTDAPANRQMICAECNRTKVGVESTLARGLVPNIDPLVLASLTPPGVDLVALVLGHGHGRGVSKVATTSNGTERSPKLCTAQKTTPPGVQPVRAK